MKARRRLAPQRRQRHDNTSSLADVLAAVRTHHPHADLASVTHAHEEAARWHEGETRRSGDPYITHCLAVAAIVAGFGMPPAVVCAALLHDIADTPCPPGRIAERFGADVAQLISAVSLAQLSALPPDGLTFEIAPPTARPTLEQAVLAIRLADRLHNMRTIAFLTPATQRRKAFETIEVLVPLARITGLTDVSSELQALSTAVLQPVPSAFAVTTRVLALLSLVLPAWQRARWREEWHAELATLPTRKARARFTFKVLLGAPALSLTLRRPASRERSW
ncbi:HD domain-containing protein [Streptomyces griseorubiginosus]|jgi:(p)ppGpp synthase/HD superfamily hydrolase|uniref:HD domain-containing protein n=1 Tax=Streptomyces griseorubiginosus TaxID=67304 RepID=UPI003326B54F